MIRDFVNETLTSVEEVVGSLTVRHMLLQDADAVANLERQVFPNPWSHESIVYALRENGHALALVAESQGEILGYVIGWRFRQEGEIGTFAVHPRYRRNRIGERLLTAWLKHMKSQETKVVYLEVRRSNRAAQNLYAAQGFRISGVRKQYYQNNREDALVMTLILKEEDKHGLV